MPRIERFFANSKVTDWTSGAFGGGGADPFSASGGTSTTHGVYTVSSFTSSGTFTVSSGSGLVDIPVSYTHLTLPTNREV